jgi:outer membrane protease
VKNIAGFAVLVIILYTFVSCPPIRGQGHILSTTPIDDDAPFPYALSLVSSAGFLHGQGEEIVYKYPGGDIKLSELLWDVKPLFYLGTALDFSRIQPLEKPGVFSSLSLKFGLPGKTGMMEDRDWMTPNDELTHYSRSDNYASGVFLLDFSLGVSLPVKKFAILKFYGIFSLMSFQWISRDGYKRYSANNNTPLDDSVGEIPLHGISVLYRQNWLLGSPGVAAQIPLSRYFRADLSFQISPLIYCSARDDHPMPEREFMDYVFGGLYLEPGGSFVFSFRDRFELSLSVSYRWISGGHGEIYERDTNPGPGGTWFKSSGESGASWRALDSGLTFKVRL